VIAIDDNDAIKMLAAEFSTVVVGTTETLVVGLIRNGTLTVADADFL